MGQTAPASAADFEPYKTYKPPVETVSAPVERHSNVYLRGFIGMTNQRIDGFTNEAIEAGNFNILQHDFDSAPLIGLGLGVDMGHRFRFDVTGEFRGSSNFRGLDTYVDATCGPGVCTNEHTGIKKEWLFLANGYWDMGTFRGITPYLGAGIGFAAITLEDFWDVNLVTNGLHWAETNTEWNFAWALHAGAAYALTDCLKLDISYRYVDVGDGVTGTYDTYDPAAPQNRGATTLKDIHSHDIMVGLRWNFGEEEQVSYK